MSEYSSNFRCRRARSGWTPKSRSTKFGAKKPESSLCHVV